MTETPEPISEAVEALAEQIDLEEGRLRDAEAEVERLEKKIASLRGIVARMVAIEGGITPAEETADAE